MKMEKEFNLSKKKHIILHVDEEFFWKMRSHKLKIEADIKKITTWEEYIKILFGMI